MNLSELGWDARLEELFGRAAASEWLPARVTRAGGRLHAVCFEGGERFAEVSGRFRYDAVSRAAFPVTGDWAAISPCDGADRATIHEILPRRTRLSRKAPGPGAAEQVLAANVDVAFIVNALDGGRNANGRRIERWLSVVADGGARPVIVLNKADLCGDRQEALLDARSVAGGAEVLLTSAVGGEGLDALRRYIPRGCTGVLLGTSGVGKSAILNRLLGRDAQAVTAVREDDLRGRHTTTARELFILPGGGMIIDTPGLRELALWADNRGVGGAFPDVDELAARCRFRDCRHAGEPGCAVQEALGNGSLPHDRFESYLHLQREIAHLARKHDIAARHAEQEKWKTIARLRKALKKAR